MEAIAAHAVLRVQLVGHGIEVRLRRHGLVEGGVEDRHVGHVREQLLTGVDAGHVRGIVQRRQGEAVADDVLDVGVDQGRGRRLLASMHDAVPDRIDLAQRSDHAEVAVGQLLADHPHGIDVGADLRAAFGAHAVRPLVHQLRSGQADPLHHPLGQHGFVGHVEERELQRRAAGIDDQDLHGGVSLARRDVRGVGTDGISIMPMSGLCQSGREEILPPNAQRPAITARGWRGTGLLRRDGKRGTARAVAGGGAASRTQSPPMRARCRRTCSRRLARATFPSVSRR